MKDTLYKVKQKVKRYLKNLFLTKDKKVNNYWIQKIKFKRIDKRLDFFILKCENKNVLHIGCTDWPIFNPINNLHIKLAKHTKTIDGFDVDEEGIINLKKYVDQDYYSSYDNIAHKKYDVCLIPETIEHVDNVRSFLNNISKIDATKFFITAPNCFSKERLKNYHIKKDIFIEVVHPDHNCWFSPYTLKNQIEKYSTLKVINVYLLENERMICCEAVKNKLNLK